jgi:RNA-dependent RNA polymerase
MLRVDTNFLLSVGFIHGEVFHTVRDFDVESLDPTLLAKPSFLALKVGDVKYSFERKHLLRFYWCPTVHTVTFEWDFNTGPKIFDEDNERTINNPLMLDAIECNALMFTVKSPDPRALKLYRKHFPFITKSLAVESQRQHNEPIPDDVPLIVGLYAETLLSMYIPRGRITANFWSTLQSVSIDEAISALVLMKKSKTMILNPTQALLDELRNLQDMEVEKWPSQRDAIMQKKNELVLVFQVEITPTKIYVTGPFPEQSNRILRKYWKFRDHFVRVRFTDEDGSSMHGLNAELEQHIIDKLKDGITLAGRNYTFLGYSNSQLRAHSCFLFTEIDESNHCVTDEDIIERLGNFPDKSPAKHGARIGQCFTATVGGIRISVNNCQVIKDVTRNGHVFSDGVGTAAYAVMDLAKKKLARYKGSEVPSAIQVRIGGAKGVLSLDNRISGLAIRLRPSMQKFDSAHKELEITDFAKYRPAFLNRQLITLLQSLGTPSSAFTKLEKAMTSRIDKLMNGDVNEETLDQITWGHSKDILNASVATFGFEDGFLRALINKHSTKALNLLIRKTRIFIPNSALAMGVLDEYGCLEENEVYYQGLTDDGEEIPIVGDVIVHRVPSLHAGDVRVLKAVRRSELSHLHNVIVFSRKGQRPIPNMISGGDLDGDQYSIIGEKSIFPREIVEPMNYNPAKKPAAKKGYNYCKDDRIRFFAHFIANDNLGMVANTWQAQCEIQEHCARSKIAVELARIHSTIVDFPKTGIPATLPDRCKTSLYPDYMGKPSNKSFPATSFIGQSHRRLSTKYGDPFQNPKFELEVDGDLSSYPGNELWLYDAREIYEEYSAEMQRLIKDFNASSDVDVVSGILPYDRRKRKRGKHLSTAEKLTLAFEDIKTRFLAQFKQGVSDGEDKLAKASAWYRAVYERSEEKPAFASFAWILGKYLVRIKEAAKKRQAKRRTRRH